MAAGWRSRTRATTAWNTTGTTRPCPTMARPTWRPRWRCGTACTQYGYSIPCYDQYYGDLDWWTGAHNCPTRYNNGAYGHGALVGFAKTAETVMDRDGTVLSKQVYWFSQVPQTLGQVTLQEVYDPDDVLLSRSRDVTLPPGGCRASRRAAREGRSQRGDGRQRQQRGSCSLLSRQP